MTRVRHAQSSYRFRLAVALSFTLIAVAATRSSSAAVAKALQKLQQQVQNVAQRAIPATVCVLNGPGSGSGVIISEDGYVLTASHVSAGARGDVRLILSDGRQVPAKPLGANQTRDAAILKITEPGPWPFMPMGKSADLRRGDWVIAMGHPGGYEPGRTPPVRLGRILTNTDGPFGLITDCTVIGGDSGGPLFNLKGEVVGIHSSIAASTTQNRHVPIDVFHRDWKQMLEGRKWGKLMQLLVPPGAGYLGVVAEPDSPSGGVKVVEVEADSAAAAAGIAVNDILRSFDGYRLANTFSLVESVAARKAHDRVEFKLARAGKEMGVTVELGARPGEEEAEAVEGDEEKDAEASSERADGDMGLPDELEELLDPFKEEAGPHESAKRQGTKIPWDAVLPQRYFAENAGNRRSNQKPTKYQKKHSSVLGGFQSVARRAALSTVGILGNGKPIALGTLIDRDGNVLSKASELRGDLTIRYPDGSMHNCRVVGLHEATDLALLRPDVSGVHGGVPVKWQTSPDPIGSIVVTPAPDGTVVSIGVISVMSRKPLESRPFLGIATEQQEAGIGIVTVVPKSAAAECGLKVGDILLKIGEKEIKTVQDVFAAIASQKPGDTITIEFHRDGADMSGTATLGTRRFSAERMGRFEAMNKMSGQRSKRRRKFARILQHDSEVPPIACGGPLVDLGGKAVGINIARSGRVESVAIPVETVQTIVDDLRDGKLPPPDDFGRDSEAVQKEIRQLKIEIRRMQRRLKELEHSLMDGSN